MVYTKEDLKAMQSWSLERKIRVSQLKIMEWYRYFNGKIYISFSGGKDSTVTLDLARRIYPDIEAVFVDTGLEYPEIRGFVKSIDNVKWIQPKMPFNQVIQEYGFPLVSKEVSKIIYYCRQGSKWAGLRLEGKNKDGSYSVFKQRFTKWKYLINAPFKVSNKCCNVMKIQPLAEHERKTGSRAIIGTLASESQQRELGWLKTGCNAFDSKVKLSKPLSFWTEQDILQYLYITKIPYCKIYGDIEPVDAQLNLFGEIGKLHTTELSRTGCMFCMYGVHLEKSPNRFQQMKKTHPKQYDYCINRLGCGKALDYINVKYD